MHRPKKPLASFARPVPIGRRALLPLAALCAGGGAWLLGTGRGPHPAGAAHLAPGPGAALWPLLDRVEVGGLGGPRYDEAVEALDGASVELAGFMLAARPAERHQRFVLTPRRLGCPACATPAAGSLVAVRCVAAIPASDEAVVLRGRLRLRRLGDSVPYLLEGATLLA